MERVALDSEVTEDLGSKPNSANSCVTLDKLYNISESHVFSVNDSNHLPAGLLENKMK